jgi:hypothetical protein
VTVRAIRTPKAKMRHYRARLRAAGMRPVQIWVPDVRSKRFDVRLRRQVAGLDAAHEGEALDFIAAVVGSEIDAGDRRPSLDR